jgi:hypothetical protein
MEQQRREPAFQPKGAIAFFFVMIAFYAALWLLFYFILVGRR